MRLGYGRLVVAVVLASASATASSEAQHDALPRSSNQGRGFRGTYVDDDKQAGATTVNDQLKEEEGEFWERLLQDTGSLAPTESPTPPTSPPPASPTLAPSPSSPVTSMAPTTTVLGVILPVAIFGGEEFENPDSYQSQALNWLEGNANVNSYSDKQIIQRYALASIYFATFAVATPATDEFLGAGVTPDGWNVTNGWLSDDEECTWFGISCDGDDCTESIQLGNNFVTGTFPPEVTLVKSSLTTLDLFKNPVYNTGDENHAFLEALPNLEFLMLQETNFRYPGLPPQLGALSNLVELDVSNTLYGGGTLNGDIFANMPFLRYLDISKNKYNSAIPNQVGELPSLENFYAVDSGIVGDLSFMESMTQITEIWVDLNPGLGGEIPDFIGDKSTLESLGLSSSGFTGPLPASMGQLVNMKSMWLYNNGFSGEVPAEFASMAGLELLQLQMNDIGGSMPQAICDLRPPGGSLNSLVADCVSEIACVETCCTACF